MLKFHPLRIAEVHPDAEDAIAVALDVPRDLRPQYAGLPGQHVVLRTQIDGEEARRTYSLINSPGEWPLRIAARIHENGRMSRFLAEQVKVGDQIDVLPPNGSLTPRVTAQKSGARSSSDAKSHRTYVGFASGCGITPVLSVIQALLQADDANHCILFYGNSGTGRAMCLEALLGLKDRYLDRLALHFVMSREPQEVELYNGRIDSARVRDVAKTLFKPDQVSGYYVCGPGDMIEQVTAALRELKVSADRIHGEHFTVATVAAPDTAGNARPPVGVDSAEVTVLVDGRRRTFTMRMNDGTVLDAAMNAGLELPFSCRAGVCSTCRTKVISGEVEMAQNYALEDWELEQGYVLACQSRVKTPTLELDYDEK